VVQKIWPERPGSRRSHLELGRRNIPCKSSQPREGQHVQFRVPHARFPISLAIRSLFRSHGKIGRTSRGIFQIDLHNPGNRSLWWNLLTQNKVTIKQDIGSTCYKGCHFSQKAIRSEFRQLRGVTKKQMKPLVSLGIASRLQEHEVTDINEFQNPKILLTAIRCDAVRRPVGHTTGHNREQGL
jgi:hypothetical protein